MPASSRPARTPSTEIAIDGARSHNLKGVSCRIPLRALTVVTGVSGSGKSSLAFDTLYAEGQRRYVASLSTYARQFLERLPRPEVDRISHLPPAIAIEQRNRVTNARSTVGTATELLDHLRLLFARAGRTLCPDCKQPVEAGTVQAVADRIATRWQGGRVSIGAPIRRAKGEKDNALRERLARGGFTRLLDEANQVVDVTELSLKRLAELRRGAGLLLVDRLAVRGGDEDLKRLGEAVAQAFQLGGGELYVCEPPSADAPEGAVAERALMKEGFACDGCGRRFPTPEPSLFSFNSPLGACETCQGFGRTAGIDRERVVPDPRLSVKGGAIAPFTTQMGRAMQRDLVRSAKRRKFPLDRPWEELSAEEQAFVFDGDEDEGGDWYGVRGFFEWLEGRRYKVQARVLIARYRRFDPCTDCGGARLRPEALCVRVAGRDIGEVSRGTVAELRSWVEALGADLGDAERARSERIVELLRERVGTVDEVGLGYLALDRQVRTLSGGEAQRIQLATALSGSLTATLYVLDEPSIGLHASDVQRLLGVLQRIRDHGNTVVLVEHALELVAAADHIIELGPEAGRRGGEVIVEGPVATVADHPSAPTGRALRGEYAFERTQRQLRAGSLRIVGAREHNLRDVDVEIPLGRLVVVTGVSGAGKSTLVRSVLVGQLEGDPERGDCDRIEGAERVREVVVVDQTPSVRSPRSNPATVSKAFEGIRKCFASTREAKKRGATPGYFSFNVSGGRCDACEGSGEVVIDMQFLDDVRVPCDDCGGTRYKREALEITLDGNTIVDVLDMTVDEAVEAYRFESKVAGPLEPLQRVGLGYLKLGQPLSTLSGGENQRLRLAQALAAGSDGALYVLDEPTTGLHARDVELLLGCLDELLDRGGSVIVIEHNLEVVQAADFVIDMGPGGGPHGGRIVAAGSADEIRSHPTSATGAAMRGERVAEGR